MITKNRQKTTRPILVHVAISINTISGYYRHKNYVHLHLQPSTYNAEIHAIIHLLLKENREMHNLFLSKTIPSWNLS